MGSMSYCRFENTLNDLTDCYDAILDGKAEDEKLSKTELQAKHNLISLCKKIFQFCEDNGIEFEDEK